MHKIYLNELLNLENKQVKVRFNQFNGHQNPLDEFLNDPEKINSGWLLWRTKNKLFKPDDVVISLLKLSLIGGLWDLSIDTWFLTTIKQITKDLNVVNGVNYEAQQLEAYQGYYGRLIIKYHKTYQNQVRNYFDICNELEVCQILPNYYDGDEFLGYDNVCLSYTQLENVIVRNRKDWIAALENQKAVYLITDRMSGKMYVGSATSNQGMLLQRWKDYHHNGHGGNVSLKEVVNHLGFDYVKANFYYSILENFNSKVDDDHVLKRESWWKEVLMTRRFGYNKN